MSSGRQAGSAAAPGGLRLLVTNVTLAGRTGTETFVRDLACGMRRRGHDVTVYSPRLGALADEIAAAGIRVVRSLREVGPPPDVVHGHHHPVTVEALAAFPSTRGLFVCHDRLAATDVPPLHPRLLRWVAVDANCAERLAAYQIPAGNVVRIPNAVDLARFASRPPLPGRPFRALAFGNDAGSLFDVGPVAEACASRGIALDLAGAGSGRPSTAPERLLQDYDLVFGKARCALEALAVGCAVVVCDARGLGEMVTRDAAGRMREWNFGMRLLTRETTPRAVAAEIDRYDPEDAARVRDFVREDADLERALDLYESIYEELVAAPAVAADPGEELRRYLTLQLDRGLAAADPPAFFGRMDALGEDAPGTLALSWVRPPERASTGERLAALVAVESLAAVRLASDPPCPVHLSYHWVDSGSGRVEVFEGLRSRLRPALEGGERREYRLHVEAPARPGLWRLRVTLVQENVAWLDGRAPHLAIETDVLVAEGQPSS